MEGTLKITFIALQYLEICLKDNILMSVAFEWTKNHVTRDLIRSIKSTLRVQDDTTIYILNQCFLELYFVVSSSRHRCVRFYKIGQI